MVVHQDRGAPGSTTGLVKKHLLNETIGVVLCGIVGDVWTIGRCGRTRRWCSCCRWSGLGLVITPLGATINGSHSWILLGGGVRGVQPSEFAKVGLLLIIAMLLAQPAEGTDRPRGLDVALALVASGITMGLVMLQPDLGTAMVLAVITAAGLIIAGMRKRWIGALTLVAGGRDVLGVLLPDAGAVPGGAVHGVRPTRAWTRAGWVTTARSR
ncbi:hypothetical protein GCM10020220_033380 [Nonomuraea rubra]|uniref:FtsW/RodA/SpoVE family cell cycle protein n=1 Tax=Nonomuraea rubra TaxID=46180 RepID=UPI0031EC7CE2